MNIFGFFHSGTSRSSTDDVLHYGSGAFGGRSPRLSARAGELQSAVWAAEAASDSDVTIALRGEPLWDRASADPSSEATLPAILELYRSKGAEAIESLSGRFAIAILDRPAGRVVLAVDPMGIERLTYSSQSEGMVFGTSAEMVANCPLVRARIRRQSIFDYLMMHSVPAPDTIFEDVRKLRAGTMAVWDNGRLTVTQWWTPRFVDHGGESEQSLAAALHSALRASVADARPDDESGAFLSGGLDSSTVAGLLSRELSTPARTFSIGFGYEKYDELPYAQIANQHFGCKGHEYTIKGADIAESFPAIARAYDEPFGNSSSLPVYYCAKLARESGVDHLLAGDGGDELFAGNTRYARQVIFRRYERLPALWKRGLIEPLLGHWPSALEFRKIRSAKAYIGRANVSLPERLEIWNLLYRMGASEVLHPEFLADIDPAAPLRRMQEVWDQAPCKSQLNRLLYYDWQYTLADNDLRKVETMSQLAGVRVSYPMLHRDVVDVSLRVPPKLKLRGTQLRYFYKRAMADFLPDEIIHKSKHGFGLPFGLWLNDSPQLRTLIMDNLSSLRSRYIVQPEFLDRLLQLHSDDDADYHGVFVWVLAMLEQWFNEHGVSP